MVCERNRVLSTAINNRTRYLSDSNSCVPGFYRVSQSLTIHPATRRVRAECRLVWDAEVSKVRQYGLYSGRADIAFLHRPS